MGMNEEQLEELERCCRHEIRTGCPGPWQEVLDLIAEVKRLRKLVIRDAKGKVVTQGAMNACLQIIDKADRERYAWEAEANHQKKRAGKLQRDIDRLIEVDAQRRKEFVAEVEKAVQECPVHMLTEGPARETIDDLLQKLQDAEARAEDAEKTADILERHRTEACQILYQFWRFRDGAFLADVRTERHFDMKSILERSMFITPCRNPSTNE